LRVLITGASGFAGSWLARACVEAGDDVVGVSRSGRAPVDGMASAAVDLDDADAVARLLAETAPDAVYHLAALSHVGRSWDDPNETLRANVVGAVNLLEAIRLHAPRARVLWASSCEVYGTKLELPVREGAPLEPVNPYAVSKATGDMLARVYADAHSLDIVRARPFNHAGPGQLPIFIVSSLAEQAARARRDRCTHVQIVTGNPDTRRDFTDVRDVVRAYRLLVDPDVPAGVYNVCSGRSISAAEHVANLASVLAPIEVEHVVDAARVRAHEVMDQRGSHERLRAATGWEPQIPLRQTMADTIAWWESELSLDATRRG
jgi:GDP-4-dehydro-6-deoxy-D-mannose reductase